METCGGMPTKDDTWQSSVDPNFRRLKHEELEQTFCGAGTAARDAERAETM